MLILSRKKGESIQIGEKVRLVVTKISGNNVRIGIDAPEEITIRRGELIAARNNDTEVARVV